MIRSFTYRLLLIGLLPLIAFLLYFKGQHYDPALINFSSPQFTNDTMTDLFPAEISGLTRSGAVRTYTKENLFEYVNGHAEYFISAGFLKLGVGEYTLNTKDEPDIIVDIYDMGRRIQAFGLLTDESRGDLSELHQGTMGIRTPRGISFAKGQYYIKISAFNDNLSLDDFAEEIDKYIPGADDPLSGFARLPDLGDVVTTRFIKEAYRGVDFITNVVEREYDVNGNTVQVFLREGSEREIQNMITAFKDYFRNSDIPYTEEVKYGNTVYQISDPYEGDWVLIALPDALFGIYGSFDTAMINAILKENIR